MANEQKSQKISETLKNSINTYLVMNSDIFGFCFVHDIIMSSDLRKAIVVVEFQQAEIEKDAFSILNESKGKISKFIQKSISSKFFPSLTFRLYKSEKNNF